eukprot:scaffold7572_cov390-Prasinococcus_capsulatus_cf.AAC.1
MKPRSTVAFALPRASASHPSLPCGAWRKPDQPTGALRRHLGQGRTVRVHQPSAVTGFASSCPELASIGQIGIGK